MIGKGEISGHGLLRSGYLGVLVGILAMLAASSASSQVSGPGAVVAALYARYTAPGQPGMPTDRAGAGAFLEPGLADAWVRNSAKANSDESLDDVVDSDPFVGGQDVRLSHVEIGRPRTRGQHVDVVVQFRNYGKQQRLTYDLVETQQGWRIYNLRAASGLDLRRLLHVE